MRSIALLSGKPPVYITILLLFIALSVSGGNAEQNPPGSQFPGCFESYVNNLVQEASAYGSASGVHMGYYIAMLRYLYPQQQKCLVDIAIYSVDQVLVDRRFVECRQ